MIEEQTIVEKVTDTQAPERQAFLASFGETLQNPASIAPFYSEWHSNLARLQREGNERRIEEKLQAGQKLSEDDERVLVDGAFLSYTMSRYNELAKEVKGYHINSSTR